jgi:hypothetical protein
MPSSPLAVLPPLVDKETGDAAWPCIQVLVRTPARKIDAPVVQLEGNIADGVRTVEPDDATLARLGGELRGAEIKSATGTDASHLGPPRFRDRLHVKPLSRVVLNSSEADDGDRVAFLLDDAEDVFCPNGMFAFPWVDGQEGRGWVVVQSNM